MERADGPRDGDPLAFSCPHCAGPLRLVPEGGVECRQGHGYRVEALGPEYARITSQALWRAARTLRDRAASARWAATNPPSWASRSPAELERAAAADDEAAELLQRQARALDGDSPA